MDFSHIGPDGYASIVDVSEKEITKRTATAAGKITMRRETLEKIRSGAVKKGDVLGTAKIAGVMASKKTFEIIPMCHTLFLEKCDIVFEFPNDTDISVKATVTATAKTGVEMEAIFAVSAALITIYDMAKSADKAMVIGDICLLEKTGGKSGTYLKA